ncbi:hypothetical protein H4S08_002877 [Coemansia sp. RSA 1365]|nr:hypothetical protein H4S08_002877 [Coemansia sp. RSA 1365]
MQQLYSSDDNYLQLSQQSGVSGGSSGSPAGPQMYRNSYPLHDTNATAVPPNVVKNKNVSAPHNLNTVPQHHLPQKQRPYVYPEIAKSGMTRPPPITATKTAPTTAYAQNFPPSATTVVDAGAIWGPPPPLAPPPETVMASPVVHHSGPYLAVPPPLVQQQTHGPPVPPGKLLHQPIMPPTGVPERPVAMSKPGQAGMPKSNRQRRSSNAMAYPPPGVVPVAGFPQSAPMSPATPYDPHMVAAQVRSHTYQQLSDAAFPQPLSAPTQRPLGFPPPIAGAPTISMAQNGPQFVPSTIAAVPQMGSSSRRSSIVQTQNQQQPMVYPYVKPKTQPNSSNGAYEAMPRLRIAYMPNKERVCERTNFNTLFHCLKPVELVSRQNRSQTGSSSEHRRGTLYPLYKVNEDWIAPNVGLPLKNKPGYRCVLYVIDGTLLYDNGLSGEKLLSKGTVYMLTTSKDISIYARNPSQTHRAHILRMWIEMRDYVQNESSSTMNSDTFVPVQPTERNRQHKKKQQGTVTHPDFHSLIRHVADSDKQNCMLILAQPDDYLPSYGMTSHIYGPMKTKAMPKDSLADVRRNPASPIESSFSMSQSMLFTRPDYFTPEPVDLESIDGEKEWGVTDPQLTSRVCVDPLKLEEDTFISLCQLEGGANVTYELYDLNDKDRAQQKQLARPGRGNYRRVWIQTIMADLNPNASANGGRLVINGDVTKPMRPGDSAYVRRLELHDTLVIENCGHIPLDFVVVEAPY